MNSLQKLHNLGRLPENDHAIWMPSEVWFRLQKLLDPLERLAASYRRICAAASHEPDDLLERLQMESILAHEPIQRGARFTVFAREKLEEIVQKLRPDVGENRTLVRETLNEILVLERSAAETDARCELSQT